jgi:MoaA/NifB/PqqE/SkfB family radical SAM enzyme
MNKYFCAAPFRNLEVRGEGRCTVCCKIDSHILDENGEPYHMYDTDISTVWNSKWMNDFRERFVEEEKRPECHRCWDDEEAGTRSLRQQINLDKYHIQRVVEEPRIEELVLKFSNKCNCACRICDWYLSSLWEQELAKSGRLDVELHRPWFAGNEKNKITDDNWDDWKKNLDKVFQVSLYGGEPLINEEALRVIDYLVDSGRSREVSLVLNTNSTVTNKAIFDKLNQFNRVDLNFSVDDIGHRYDYERWPSKSANIFKELKELHDTENYNNINIGLYTTISIFNVLHLGDILEKFRDYNKWKVNFENMAYIPKQLNMSLLPEVVKPKVEEYLLSVDWRNTNWHRENHDYKTAIINFLYLQKSPWTCEGYVIELDKKLGIDDKRRNQNWRETFPKLYDLLLQI